MLGTLRRLFGFATAAAPRIVSDDAGLGIRKPGTRNGETGPRVPWHAIVEVRAYKRDLITTDLICLVVSTVAGPALELSEDMEGWDALLVALPDYLPGCLTGEQILARVLQPPMAANETVVYAREAQPAL